MRKKLASVWRVAGRLRVLELGVCALATGIFATELKAQEPKPQSDESRFDPFDALDNVLFSDVGDPAAKDSKAHRASWWLPPIDALDQRSRANGSDEKVAEWQGIETPAGVVARQAVAAYSPALRVPVSPTSTKSRTLLPDPVDGFEVNGVASGPCVVTLIDGSGGRASVRPKFSGASNSFTIPLREFDAQLGRPAVPRFEIELSNDGSDVPVRWSWVRVRALMPSVWPSTLEALIRAELDSIFDIWLTRCVDREGPKQTSFTCTMIDVVTGEKILTASAVSQPQPLYELMLDAYAIDHDAKWRAALERYLDDFLTLGVHPTTGLPRQWDCIRDVPLDDAPFEIAKAFEWLLDAAEKGPETYRERALAAAKKIGDTVLAHGILPDGSIAPIYVPASGAPKTDAASLRRLDVPAVLTRLSKATGDLRYVDAARRATAEFEFTNFWPGTWNDIDPGFDDSFGHYGARAVTMLECYPNDPLFKRVAESGWRTYAPLWRDALRFGGSIAADQVRCWDLLERYTRLSPSSREEFSELLADAVRAHFKGEQYNNGAWGDVTFFEFNPKTGLAVGDLPGAPANLLWGLGIASRKTLDWSGVKALGNRLPNRSPQSLFTAVFLSTLDTYKRPFGYLSTQRQRDVTNPGAGELRCARGLVEMLGNL